jgi:hypothetical protein
MTAQELIDLINTNLEDNNTKDITPAILRNLLLSLFQSQDLQTIINNGGVAFIENLTANNSNAYVRVESEEFYSKATFCSSFGNLAAIIGCESGEALFSQIKLNPGDLSFLSKLCFEEPIGTEAIFKIPAKPNGNYVLATMQDLANLRPYKVYTALLTQSGTDAPVATVLENTLGYAITFNYQGVGMYSVNENPFDINKTFCLLNQFGGNIGTYNSAINIEEGAIVLRTSLDGVAYDTLLQSTPIEIRVYN